MKIQSKPPILDHDDITRENCCIMNEIGAPWSWMNQFVMQNIPNKSYNFIERQNGDADSADGAIGAENAVLNEQCEFECNIEPIPGCGGLISVDTTQRFLTHIRYRSKDENGMVFPRHFAEANCPGMTDE